MLFLPFRNGFPLDSEIDRLVPGALPAVPESVIDELDRLIARGTADAQAARTLARRFPSAPTMGTGDDAILRSARRGGTPVVTADAELRRRLLAAGVPVLAPRDRHRLELHLPRVSREAGKPRRPANR